MKHLFKKFTPLFLAAALCLSAAPAQSVESWSSFALKGVGTWAACVGIGLGTVIAHEYGHVIAAEILEPGSVNAIVIGNIDEKRTDIGVDYPLLKPILLLFPDGFTFLHALGGFKGFVRRHKITTAWNQVAIAAAGPLTGSAFSLAILATINNFLPREGFFGKVLAGVLYTHILGDLIQLAAPEDRGPMMRDGNRIQKNLGIDQRLYNTLAFPVLCYAIHRISKI